MTRSYIYTTVGIRTVGRQDEDPQTLEETILGEIHNIANVALESPELGRLSVLESALRSIRTITELYASDAIDVRAYRTNGATTSNGATSTHEAETSQVDIEN